MCIIASIPKGAKIDNATLETMWKHNSDGGGISWIDDKGKIRVFKTMKLKPFISKFNEVIDKYGDDADVLVHMRIATHGSVCMDNNHPFNVDTQTVFAHNGILPHQFHPPAKRDISDTRYFNETFLQYQKLTALDDSRYIDHLGNVIGSYNKLVILTANPKLRRDSYIINEASGEWSDGVWYSNDSYLEYSAKMKWGTKSYVNKLTEPAKSKPVNRDQGASCTIGDEPEATIQLFDVELCDQWGLIPQDAWSDEECADMIVEMMVAYGYDAPQDMMEDFQWHVRDNKIKCQKCNAEMDVNQYWPDCGADCVNYTDGEHLEAIDIEVDDPKYYIPESADDISEDWFITGSVEDEEDITAQEALIIEQQKLFGKD